MSTAVPLHLTVHPSGPDAGIAVLVGRRQVPLADADPGVQAAWDQALTDYDGRVSGPLASGPAALVDGRLVLG